MTIYMLRKISTVKWSQFKQADITASITGSTDGTPAGDNSAKQQSQSLLWL